MSTEPQQSWTIGGLLSWTAPYLTKKGCEFPRSTRKYAGACLGCRRIDLYARYEEPRELTTLLRQVRGRPAEQPADRPGLLWLCAHSSVVSGQ